MGECDVAPHQASNGEILGGKKEKKSFKTVSQKDPGALDLSFSDKPIRQGSLSSESFQRPDLHTQSHSTKRGQAVLSFALWGTKVVMVTSKLDEAVTSKSERTCSLPELLI